MSGTRNIWENFLCFGELAVPISLTSSGPKIPGKRCRQGYGVVLGGGGTAMSEEVLWDSENTLPLSTPPPLAGGQLLFTSGCPLIVSCQPKGSDH